MTYITYIYMFVCIYICVYVYIYCLNVHTHAPQHPCIHSDKPVFQLTGQACRRNSMRNDSKTTQGYYSKALSTWSPVAISILITTPRHTYIYIYISVVFVVIIAHLFNVQEVSYIYIYFHRYIYIYKQLR